MINEIKESVEFINERINSKAKTAIVLGTGLSRLIQRLEIIKEISYKVILTLSRQQLNHTPAN